MTPRQEQHAAKMRLRRYDGRSVKAAIRAGRLAEYWEEIRAHARVARAAMGTPDDRQSVLDWEKERDKADLDRLIEENLHVADMVARRCLRNVPPTVEYDDMRSVAALAIVRSAARYNGSRSSAKTFFYECAQRSVTDFLRREFLRKRRMVQFPRDLGEVPEDPRGLVERDVETLVYQLPFLQSVALSLKYLDGLSDRESAERMGIKMKSFQRLEKRGRDRLRKKISSKQITMEVFDVAGANKRVRGEIQSLSSRAASLSPKQKPAT